MVGDFAKLVYTQFRLHRQDFFRRSNPSRFAVPLNTLQALTDPQPQQPVFDKLLVGHPFPGLLIHGPA